MQSLTWKLEFNTFMEHLDWMSSFKGQVVKIEKGETLGILMGL